MAASHEWEQFRQLAQRIDPRSALLRTWSLAGGISARVTGLEMERADGQTTKLIVRQYGSADLRANPRLARDEFKLLQVVRSKGLAAPKPCYFDESRSLFPVPLLVTEYVEGATEFTPDNVGDYLLQSATYLARVHRVNDSPDLDFLPRQGKGFGERPARLDTSLNEDGIRDALESAGPLCQMNASVLLHGDFWPGNILWKDDLLVAVIDWEDANIGDPLADLANARLECMWAFGVSAMNEFTSCYTSMTDINVANLPYWDLCAALRPCSKMSAWGLDDSTEARMRERHSEFITQALEQLLVR